jgi:hypothetical protein
MTKTGSGGQNSRHQIIKKRSRLWTRRFKPLIETNKKVHPLARATSRCVAKDLREGSLESLALYLKAGRDIFAGGIAEELVRLLEGSGDETSYRVAVIRHPDLQRRSGIKKSAGVFASQADRAVAAYAEMSALKMKKQMSVVNATGEHFAMSASSVRRAIERVAAANIIEREAEAVAVQARKASAAREKLKEKLAARIEAARMCARSQDAD